ncbi:MAG: ABC-2 type transport system ATP-binding protein [Planctomycetota bacterium]|jgi:ABC-2 type transport system ATP-binding protein
MDTPPISIRGLEKRYGKVHALRGVTMEVPSGPVGLLGPNGAGKTTLIKLLLGLLVPSKGEATIAGCSPRKRADRLEVRKRVGYMPEGDCLLPGMSGVELVSTLARLTGLSKQDAMTRAHEALDYVELDEQRYRPLDQYSTGMKQKLKLAQALVHDPPILLLDEPTNGLDPAGRRHMLSLIEDLGRVQGKSVLLCSHLLRDVERTCDHVVVLHQGTVVKQGAVAELTRADTLSLRVWVTGDQAVFRQNLQAAGVASESKGDEELLLTLPEGTEDADGVFAQAADCGAVLTRVESVRSTLEDVFLSAVGETEPGKGNSSA